MQPDCNYVCRRNAVIRGMFDTEQFIQEVEARESIWNQKNPQYTDRLVKNRQWNELVDIFGGDDLSPNERAAMCEGLQKKWKNIRDNYVKEHKIINYPRSGSAAKRKSRYVYYEQLSFLKDVLANNSTEGNHEVTPDMQESTVETKEKPRIIPYIKEKPKIKKRKEDPEDFGKELIGVLRKSQKQRAEHENDPDRLFFLSLVKDFKQIPEYLQMDTKCQIMQLIKNARFQHDPSYPKIIDTIPGSSGNSHARQVLDPEEAAAILRACDVISPSSEVSHGSE